MARFIKTVTALAALALVGLAGYYVYSSMNRPVPVKTVNLVRGDLMVSVTATTTSTIESERYVTVSARRMGAIDSLPVKEGDFVREGQLIALLDTKEVAAELGRAEAGLELARKRLAQTEAGVYMEKASTQAALKEAESVLWDSESTLERYRLLFENGMVSRQDYDSVRKARDVAKARYDTAKAGLDANKVKEQDVAAARASVGEAEAAVASVKVQLGYCTITSPIKGVISKLPVDRGETVNIGTVIAEVLDPKDIYVKSTIDEVDIGKLKPGMPVKINVDAVPDTLLDGTVTRISPIVSGEKQETRTFEVRTVFDKENDILRPGMSADIEVLSKEIKGILHIPAQSVIERDGKKLVYVARDGRARLVPVEMGYYSWSDAEITSGLSEGDTVITTPDATGLKDGARVEMLSGE